MNMINRNPHFSSSYKALVSIITKKENVCILTKEWVCFFFFFHFKPSLKWVFVFVFFFFSSFKAFLDVLFPAFSLL